MTALIVACFLGEIGSEIQLLRRLCVLEWLRVRSVHQASLATPPGRANDLDGELVSRKRFCRVERGDVVKQALMWYIDAGRLLLMLDCNIPTHDSP